VIEWLSYCSSRNTSKIVNTTLWGSHGLRFRRQRSDLKICTHRTASHPSREIRVKLPSCASTVNRSRRTRMSGLSNAFVANVAMAAIVVSIMRAIVAIRVCSCFFDTRVNRVLYHVNYIWPNYRRRDGASNKPLSGNVLNWDGGGGDM